VEEINLSYNLQDTELTRVINYTDFRELNSEVSVASLGGFESVLKSDTEICTLITNSMELSPCEADVHSTSQ
jgi:hypothetical protein